MCAKRRMAVEVSIPALVGEVKDDFWGAMFKEVFDVLGRMIVAGVESEMTEFVGAGRHEREAADRRTTRAGWRPRRFTVLGRDVMLRLPRARIAGFRSRLVPYRKRRHAAFDGWAVEAYIAGASMRETTAQLWNMFGTSISPTTISGLVEQLDAERRAFQSRPLADHYVYLVLDGMRVNALLAAAPSLQGIPHGEGVDGLVVLLVRGIKADGTRELIDFRVVKSEGEEAWERFLLSLFNRGLEGEAIKCFVHDGSEGLENAVHSVYGPMPTQRCICHKLSNVWGDVADKDNNRSIRKDASAVYNVDTQQQARQRLVAFRRKWTPREPKAVATMCRQFDATLTYFTIPVEHRRWMRTTNPIERTIRELRRRTRPMGVFQGIASCRRLVYVAVKKLSNQRRNAIPYSLWTSQPAYGTKRRSRRSFAPPDIDALRKELHLALRRGPF